MNWQKGLKKYAEEMPFKDSITDFYTSCYKLISNTYKDVSGFWSKYKLAIPIATMVAGTAMTLAGYKGIKEIGYAIVAGGACNLISNIVSKRKSDETEKVEKMVKKIREEIKEIKQLEEKEIKHLEEMDIKDESVESVGKSKQLTGVL